MTTMTVGEFSRTMATTSEDGASAWNAIGRRTEQSHAEKGAGNQDSLIIKEPRKGSVLLAVADGHGSDRHLRSARGSAFACQAFAEAIATLLGEVYEGEELNAKKFEELSGRHFQSGLVKRWRDYALNDTPTPSAEELLRSEMTSGEWAGKYLEEAVDTPEGYRVRTDASASWLHLYGTTLVGALATPDLVALWHLGDGSSVLVDSDYEVHQPIPELVDLPGEAVQSMSGRSPQDDFRRQAYFSETARRIRGVVLCTDGVDKSYASNTDFFDTVRNFVRRGESISSDQLGILVENSLETWKSATGDDATFAIAINHSVKGTQ